MTGVCVCVCPVWKSFHHISFTGRNEEERRRQSRRKRISQDTKMETIPNCETWWVSKIAADSNTALLLQLGQLWDTTRSTWPVSRSKCFLIHLAVVLYMGLDVSWPGTHPCPGQYSISRSLTTCRRTDVRNRDKPGQTDISWMTEWNLFVLPSEKYREPVLIWKSPLRWALWGGPKLHPLLWLADVCLSDQQRLKTAFFFVLVFNDKTSQHR